MKPSLRHLSILVPATVVLAAIVAPAKQAQATKKIDFNRDVRMTLTKCFTCHGPDNGEGVAGLRLDNHEGATKALPSGNRAIVPGKPEESELVKRIHADDYLKMPPEASNKTLSAEEKQVLTEWIKQGAEYKEHWAFVRPVKPDLPKVSDPTWVRNGIDNFILAKLDEHGLKPEREADKRTLIRRVTLDISGLPPTKEEVDAFLADRSPNAYEKVVDRLLASPRYGERMAMDWMDYARYADSNGYQADYERFQWRWRDWVIEAFNKNMPYDQFTVEQIAGDMLPNATFDQKLATGFNRNHRINTEGGVIAEEWRVETVVDRMETTTAVWLGITAGCARCHDHKYDPLTQKDFYRMYSYFNNVPETGSGEERPVNHPPLMDAPTREQSDRLGRIEADSKTLATSMDAAIARNASSARGWKPNASLPVLEGALLGRFALVPGGPGLKPEGKPTFDAGRATGAVKTSNDSFLDLGNFADVERDKPFSYGAWIKSSNGEGAPFSRMDSGNAYRGWELSLFGARPQAHLINKWPENALKVAAKQMIPRDRWVHVFMTYDGSSKAAGFKMYIDGKLVETTIENDRLSDTIRTQVSTKIGRRTNSEFFNGDVDDFAFYARELKPEEVSRLASTHPALALLARPEQERTADQKREIVRLWSLENDKDFAEDDKTLAALSEERRRLAASIPSVMVMAEMPNPRETHVLERGVYDKPGEKVEPGVPTWLPPLPSAAPNNRLGFAKWIASNDNPLTARVTVNRLWERFFGNGIVATLEDFGTRAEYPSHPELLDYLAIEFVDGGWNLKSMVKMIVTSAAYRQSSHTTDAKREHDPLNRLVSRGPRYRLSGEVIRDQALFVSGLLVEKLGGPSVYPYMPEGVWDETNFYGNLRNYRHATDEGLYRRSLYTIWKRTAAPPNMLVFDVPGREACRVQRARTDTPLQALTLMNDETYVEAARVLAQRAMREGGKTPDQRLTWAFETVLARTPTKTELEIMTSALTKRIAKYKQDSVAARDLVLIGESRVDWSLDFAELAAYTISCSTLLNLDETINKE